MPSPHASTGIRFFVSMAYHITVLVELKQVHLYCKYLAKGLG